MASLTIHVREKFVNDTVVVQADGVEIFRQEGLTTKLLLGYAAVRTVPLRDGPCRIEVGVPSRDLSSRLDVEVTNELHVEVRLLDGMLDVRVPPEPPAYL